MGDGSVIDGATTAVSADILVITHRSPEYAARTIRRLLECCVDGTQVWIWHNGDDEETLAVASGFAPDPRVAAFHHSRENVKLREPTNWLWERSSAEFVSKVDDDCLQETSWLPTLAAAHGAFDGFGALAAWRFQPEDFRPDLAEAKIATFGGHRVLQNFWVQGSGYLVRRATVARFGPLRAGESWPRYCLRMARAGLVNGWCFPFVLEDHMDDPRSSNTLLRGDDDLQARLPLSAQARGIRTLDQWTAQMRRSAYEVQAASIDPRDHWGPRVRARRALRRFWRGPPSEVPGGART